MDQYSIANVVTPVGLVYDHHAAIVVVRTAAGEFGISPKRAPIIVPLTIDEVRVRRTDSDTHTNWIAINGGVMEVRNGVVSIIANNAEHERSIDIPRAERVKQCAKRQIEKTKAKQDTNELKRTAVASHRAINRIKVSKHL